MTSAANASTALTAAIGTYPRTRALKEGGVGSALLQLQFAEVATISRAFAPMVRELRFDISEMAIATYLQAKAFGKPLVLLPVTLAARFQESALLCRVGSDISGPADLRGRRIGVRAYSQTTGMWLRGILLESFDLAPSSMAWVTFEDAHVAEVTDPPWAKRAPPGADMLAMLRRGELDAVVVGNDAPNDPDLRTVFSDPSAAADAFWSRHGLAPVNHLLCVRQDLAIDHSDLVVELMRMIRASAAQVPTQSPDLYPMGRTALRPALALAVRYMQEQDMLPLAFDPASVWDGLPDQIA